MKINKKSLCRTCVHAIVCSLTSNKKFIWSCSEYDAEIIENANLKSILIPNFSFAKSGKEFKTI
ncbi:MULTISPECIES: hypothetical protein [unclassified Polaribacter]|uniref:hypothetical protein n=1 Tax=unclassified Polaribacter TaxID=196858 RepID=UPI0011BE3EEF|nr:MULTISPECIES: hypothetical protein [unclassified Polaribacter]TXD53039.1 hypothetical protein ES043_05745 [Polaribacter sp. IC063]TXD59460.1 hypothetical protein ES044_10005 [Polaribacter sp. IC066]